MNLNPLHDRVIVRCLDADTQSSGGIIIPDNVAEKPTKGLVLAVGEGRRTTDGVIIPMTLKVNDTVLFAKHSGQPVKIEGEELLVLKEEEIFAVIGE